MDVWPSGGSQTKPVIDSDCESDTPVTKIHRRNDNTAGGYPLYEGGLTSANLWSEKGRLKWTFLSEEIPGRRLVMTRDTTLVFPATRPQPLPVTKASIKQQAEEAANFVHLHYPDVEFASDIIREHLTGSITRTNQLQKFDSYVGNLLTPLAFELGPRKRTAYMCFPMGETGCDLNISPISYSVDGGVTFAPTAKTPITFDTPIEQLASVPHRPGRPVSSLVVRTMTSTTLLHIDETRGTTQLEKFGIILSSDLGNQRTVDVHPQLTSSNATALLATDGGSVYKCTFAEGSKFMQRVYCAGEKDNFYRMAPSNEEEQCLLMSSSSLKLLDLRTQQSPISLIETRRLGECFTSIEGMFEDQMFRLCSTNEILWVDKRYSSKPVVAVRHGRRFDRTLCTRTMTFADATLTFLHCSSNGLMTVYDVSRSPEVPVNFHVPPYSLPVPSIITSRLVGNSLFRHPGDSGDSNASFIRLSEAGAIYKVDFTFSEDQVSSSTLLKSSGFKWSPDVHSLAQSAIRRSDHGPMGARRLEEQNFSELYQAIFCHEVPAENPEAIYDLLDNMSSCWQGLEPPIEYPLTTYEIALLSEQESSGNSRAEATASSILGSVRGYRALVQGRIPGDKLKRRAAWHLDLTPTLQHLIPDMCYDPQEIVKSVEQLDLISEEDRPPKCLRTESEAREQLALDLVLSADVFSQRPVQKTSTTTTDDPLEVMSRATEAMSLGDSEPPVVQFGFLQPVAARCGDLDATLRDGMQVVQTEDEVGDVEDSEPLVDPLGIRLLLSEWAIGSHPQDYVYEDPYGVCEVHYRKRLLPTTLQVTAGSALQNIVSQGPPTVAPTAPPVLSTRLLPSNGPRSQPSSQPQMLPPPTFGSQLAQMDWESTRGSQTLLPSTQVLPGPHGGRFSIAKKHAKKRVGGF